MPAADHDTSPSASAPLGPPGQDLERVEAAGYADLFHAAPADLARRHGIAVAPLAGGLCLAIASLPGHRAFNRAAGLGRWGVASDDDLERVERFYTERGLSHVASVCDRAQADGLDRRLRDRGYTDDYAWIKFAHRGPVVRVPDGAPSVRRVGSERAGGFGAILGSVFEMPEDSARWLAALPGRQGWSCFMAFEGDTPIGAAALFIDADEAWVTFGATLPEHRRKGAQQALLAARLVEARARGCAVVVSETGEPAEGRPNASYRNLVALGFVPRCRRPNLRSPS
jgi:GNAT superfamily N-acetyltransferase